MGRQQAIDRAHASYESGEFITVLKRRVGFRTESQVPEQRGTLLAYLVGEMMPSLA